MRRFCIKNIIIFIIIIFTFLGCAKSREIEVSNTAVPTFTEQPFFISTDSLSGGDGLSSQNLADIKIENLENNKVKMTLSFMTGSGISLIDQQVSSGVPNYSINHIEGLDRMVVKLDGISNWTYKIYDEEIQNNKLIQGVLKQEPIGSDSLYLYISTKDDYFYRVDTVANKIEITFSHIDEALSYSYYIKINAFVEYQNGYFNREDFYPCLSNDEINGVLISKPFDTLDEANAYLNENKDEIQIDIPSKELSVIYLGSNELPEYNYQNQLEQIVNKPIGYKNDEPVVGIPLITEGRFLSWSKDKKGFTYAKPYTLLGSQVGDVYSYEELWMRTEESDISLLDYQFTSILNARYSYDNNLIAFIEQNDETRMLQILDTQNGNVYIPADEGFGIDTSSFVWSNKDNRLFAITGTHDSKQLLCYDMRNMNDISVYALEEEEYMESSLDLFDDSIYYLKSNSDNLTTDIYTSNIETGSTRKLLSANSFMLSTDGNNLTVNDMQYDNVDEYEFYVYNTNSKDKYVVENGKMIMDYTWSNDNTRVYYTVYKNAGWEEEYPLELYYYDIQKNQSIYVMDMITGALYPAYDDEQVLVMSIHQLQDKQITITYQVH